MDEARHVLDVQVERRAWVTSGDARGGESLPHLSRELQACPSLGIR